MFERFTDRARRVIVLAQEEARALQHNYIGTEHLLLGLIREGEGVAAKALASKGVELDATRKQVEEMIGKGNAAPNGHIPFTPHAKQVLEFSLREALQLGHSYIGTEHILLGLIREGEGVGTQVLIKMDVDLGELRSATIDMIRGNSGTGTGDGKGDLANAGGVTDKQNKSGSAILDQFGRNLTAEAAEGKLDPVIGRTNEIERVMVVLSRRTKNNPVLIGEPGVGKTAVVEGLAQKIQAGDVPETLKGKQVYSLDLGSMVAGSRYRGDFEERLKKVLKEIKTRGDIVLFIDESHVTLPQVRGMYAGDHARKQSLIDYGFRLPSCVDNRPLKFDEWNAMRGQTIFVSATPGDWELEQSGGSFVEQVIRPTGLADPVCVVRPVENQIDDLMEECRKVIAKGERVLVTTLTKKMAEDLTEYLNDNGIKVRYLHSDIDTLERIEIIRDLRLGVFDVLVGINLLREGLDIPECSLVAILDADKEGFLRSTRSLIQTIGRAARNAEGKVILYADKITGSIKQALDETQRRREKQMKYNAENGITPKTIKKSISATLKEMTETDFVKDDAKDIEEIKNVEKKIKEYTKLMKEAAANLEFETAVIYRDKIKELELLAMKNL